MAAAASTTTLTSSQFVAAGLSSPRRCFRLPVVAAAAVATPPPASKRGGKTKTLYEVLKVKETASVREIKAAYRSLAKLAHPDVAPPPLIGDGDRVDFLEIRRAYETLSDPQERARYDLEFNRVDDRDQLEVFGLGFGFGLRFAGSGRVGMRRWETDQCW